MPTAGRSVHIPFLDLRSAYCELSAELDAAYRRVMESGWYVLGKEVESFEEEWAGYCGVKHSVGVGNGLDALHLLLRAINIGPGDEVIVPANTFIATWLAVTYAGATPVPVEPDPVTYNLDAGRIEECLTSRTRAIVAVHLYGQPADMDRISDVASRHGLAVIEDAAQAHGARYKGRRVGGLGNAAAWSFYPGKNLGGFGDGGAVTTNDSEVARRVRMLRSYGARLKYVNEVPGFNSRLDPLQAAFLRVRLSRLDEWNARRESIAHLYLDRLRKTGGLCVPEVPSWAAPVWHLFVVKLFERDRVQSELEHRGIGTLIHYPVPPHQSRAYRDQRKGGPGLPIAENLANTVLSLPMGPHLAVSDAEEVAAATAQSALRGRS